MTDHKDGRHGPRRLKVSKLEEGRPLKGTQLWTEAELEHMNQKALAALHAGLPDISLALSAKRSALREEYYRRTGRWYQWKQ